MGKKKFDIGLLLLSIVCVVLILSTMVISVKFSHTGLMFGDIYMESSSILGCITAFQLMAHVGLTLRDWKKGRSIAYVFQAVSLLSSTSSFIGGNVRALPGILMTISSFAFVTVLSSRLRIIELNNEVYHQISITDSLTGLLNRRGMRKYAEDMIEKKQPFYLIFFDLDNFKYVNDTIGHSAGDRILETVGKRCYALDNDCLVSRNGGDEFVIIVPDNGDVDITGKLDEYIEAINKEIFIEDVEINYSISASLGVSHYPTDADTIDVIINYADAAMYVAKKKGKNRYKFFSKVMAVDTIHDKAMEDIIVKGLKENRFYLVYQPQFEANTKKLRGFESLIRFKDEKGNIISPVEFIPVAEKSDLIFDIDHYVLKYMINDFGKIVKEAKDPFVISVNISAKHISGKNFANEVKELLEKTGFPPQCLEIEITEYGMIRDFEKAMNTLNSLNEVGVKIALDDFGTGYASLSNLTKLPIDLIKIDRSFIDNLSKSDKNKEFVEAIISMGHMLQCKIISEGVEIEEQLEILIDSKCDYIQGYVWGKPAEFEEVLKYCN